MLNSVAPDGRPFSEGLQTRHVDGGSAMTERHRHQFGTVVEHDRHETWFAEASITGANGKHTWAAGAALMFVQDDYDLLKPTARFRCGWDQRRLPRQA
jgi:hypothetical protein